MHYQTFLDNWKMFTDLIDTLPQTQDETYNSLLKRYVNQNLMLFNDVFETSINYLQKLQSAQSANDVICNQARFTNEISNKLSLSAQRFLNASLGHIADYNEWLKNHCDLATD